MNSGGGVRARKELILLSSIDYFQVQVGVQARGQWNDVLIEKCAAFAFGGGAAFSGSARPKYLQIAVKLHVSYLPHAHCCEHSAFPTLLSKIAFRNQVVADCIYLAFPVPNSQRQQCGKTNVGQQQRISTRNEHYLAVWSLVHFQYDLFLQFM